LDERRLRVFENRVLRRTFGHKRDEVTGEWRKLHYEELYAVYSSPNINQMIKSIRVRWTGHVAHMGEQRAAYKVVMGYYEDKIPIGKRRWNDNIKMDLQEIGWGLGLVLSGSGYGQVASCCKYYDKVYVSVKFGEFLDEFRKYLRLKTGSDPRSYAYLAYELG
jgi:hypothetical protein